MIMYDVHMKIQRLRCNNQYKCHSKSWACKKTKLLQAPKRLHVAPAISNRALMLPLKILKFRLDNWQNYCLSMEVDLMQLHVELVGLGSSSSMDSFASSRLVAAEWRRRKGVWRCLFKEKRSQEQTHHHRKPWIRA